MRRLLFVSLLSACAADSDEVDVTSVRQDIGCSPLVCGGNSPTIAHYGMFDFSIDPRQRNAAGFAVLGLVQGNRGYELSVRDSELVGSIRGTPVLTGAALRGARIVLDHYGTQFVIIIDSVHALTDVVAPFDPLSAYVLQWDAVIGNPIKGPIRGGTTIDSPVEGGKPTNVCPAPPTEYPAWEETHGMSPWDSVVFEGDRFDPATLTVAPIADDTWWNVGCNAHLLAKLRLTRNTIHTARAWQNEQAAMKALAADYCNTGRSFTYSGEPLVWRDKGTMFFFGTGPVDLEARWDENGARCLGSPRLDRTANAQAAIDFPDLAKAIAAECPKLPACTNPDPSVDEVRPELVTTGNYD